VLAAVDTDGFGDSQKRELQRTLADLALPKAVTNSIGTEIYTARLRNVASDGKIPSEEEGEKLVALRGFLDVPDDAVADAHEATCSKAYKESVQDVIKSASKPVPDEYWDGLQTLQKRLALTEASASRLFAQEAIVRMKELGEKAVDAMEAQVERAQKEAQKKEGKEEVDEAGSMAMDAGMSLTDAVTELIDFCTNSRVLTMRQADVGGARRNTCGHTYRRAARARRASRQPSPLSLAAPPPPTARGALSCWTFFLKNTKFLRQIFA